MQSRLKNERWNNHIAIYIPTINLMMEPIGLMPVVKLLKYLVAIISEFIWILANIPITIGFI